MRLFKFFWNQDAAHILLSFGANIKAISSIEYFDVFKLIHDLWLDFFNRPNKIASETSVPHSAWARVLHSAWNAKYWFLSLDKLLLHFLGQPVCSLAMHDPFEPTLFVQQLDVAVGPCWLFGFGESDYWLSLGHFCCSSIQYNSRFQFSFTFSGASLPFQSMWGLLSVL